MSERKLKHEKTNEKIDYICSEIAEGRSLRSICSEDDMPSVGTFLRWVTDDAKLMEQYARAREIQADYFADDMTQIADDCSVDDVQKARLQIDTRKWVASKLKPKKYGDKLDLNHSGGIQIVELDADDLAMAGVKSGVHKDT